MSSREETSVSGPEGAAVGEEHEEPTEGESTESEDETGQHRKTKERSRQLRRGSIRGEPQTRRLTGCEAKTGSKT